MRFSPYSRRHLQIDHRQRESPALAVPGAGVPLCVRVGERVQEKNIIIYYNIYNIYNNK